MLEKSQNLRDALELIRMLEQLFGSISRTNEQVPWRGVELTLRQIALSIVNSVEENVVERSVTSGGISTQPSAPLKGSFGAQGYAKKQSESLSSQIQTVVQAAETEDANANANKFRNRATVVDRVQTSPVGGFKNKSFAE